MLKPNFLAEGHGIRRAEWEQVITHGSLVRAVLDYVLLALDGHGAVSVADGPQYDSDWDLILARTGTREVVEYCRSVGSVPIELIDLREYKQEVRGDVIQHRVQLPSDPRGGIVTDLGAASAFVGHGGAGRYYGSDYDQAETNRHHSDGRHEYRLSATATEADVFINLPKLKTHKKVGVTLCLKNLVGINVGRNWLPHHTDGDPGSGGDQFRDGSLKGAAERALVRRLQRGALHSRLVALLYAAAKAIGKPFFGRTARVTRHGNWAGNDTAWRMVLDINRCLLYSGAGEFPRPAAKGYFAFVDGVIGGDGDGPACPDPVASGAIVAGGNPAAVDAVCTRLMGFDPMRLPQLRGAFAPHSLPLARFGLEDVTVVSNEAAWQGRLVEMRHTFQFKPHFGWVDAIEASGRSQERGVVSAAADSPPAPHLHAAGSQTPSTPLQR